MLKNRYELGLAFLLFCTWGFVFLDRTAISFIFPVLSQDLHLSNTHIGLINMWTTIGYVVFAILFSFLADRTGNRKLMLIIAVLATSVFAGLSAVATGFLMLVLIRFLVGASEGPVLPLSMTLMSQASSPGKFGRNAAIINAGVGVMAFIVGPVIVTQLLSVTSWRVTFLLVCVPSLIFALILMKYIKPEYHQSAESSNRTVQAGERGGGFWEVIKYRNVVISSLISMCALTSYWIIIAFGPTYWVEVGNLSIERMGVVSSIAGLIGMIWIFIIPILSDYIGRKPVMIVFSFAAALCPLAMYLFPEGFPAILMYVLAFNLFGALAPLFMNMIPLETVPDRLAATSNALGRARSPGCCPG